MEKFQISAEVKIGSNLTKYNKEITANDEKHAQDILMCLIGSKHGAPRRFINILRIARTSKGSIVLNDSNKENV